LDARLRRVPTLRLLATVDPRIDQAKEIRVVCDAPPGRNMPTLVEVEDETGRAVSEGQWRQRHDGYWELVIPVR
jgi:hypothetical protein